MHFKAEATQGSKRLLRRTRGLSGDIKMHFWVEQETLLVVFFFTFQNAIKQCYDSYSAGIEDKVKNAFFLKKSNYYFY